MASFSLTRPADPSRQATMLSVLRIVAGFLYVCHGAAKLFGVLGGAGGPGPPTVVHFPSLLGLAGIIEFFGGALILLGLFTQIAAFIASGEMACAYFLVHIHRSVWPIQNRGDNVVLFCFVFLFLAFVGGGPYSLDAVFRKSSANAPPTG